MTAEAPVLADLVTRLRQMPPRDQDRVVATLGDGAAGRLAFLLAPEPAPARSAELQALIELARRDPSAAAITPAAATSLLAAAASAAVDDHDPQPSVSGTRPAWRRLYDRVVTA